MRDIIDQDDKVWKLFQAYTILIGEQTKEIGMDVYGTEQLANLAKSLTIAHMLDHVVCQLKTNEKGENSRYAGTRREKRREK